MTASVQALSATPVVAVVGALLVAGVAVVLLYSFVTYRRSTRRSAARTR